MTTSSEIQYRQQQQQQERHLNRNNNIKKNKAQINTKQNKQLVNMPLTNLTKTYWQKHTFFTNTTAYNDCKKKKNTQ